MTTRTRERPTHLAERPAAEHEAHAVAALLAAAWPDTFPEARVRTAWSSPRLSLEHDTRVAVGGDGALAGYAEVQDLDGSGTRFGLLVAGSAPEQLAAWAERRVARAAAAPAAITCYAWRGDRHLGRVLDARGYRVVRSYFRMGLELDAAAPLEPPAWPPNVRVRTLRPGDETAVYELHQEVFAGGPRQLRMSYDDWAHWLLASENFAPSLWYLAEADGELVGLLIGERDDADPDAVWALFLAVRGGWRGTGVGLALARHGIREMQARGVRRVLAGVDGDNRARRMYERVGLRILRRFDVYEKQVAPAGSARARAPQHAGGAPESAANTERR